MFEGSGERPLFQRAILTIGAMLGASTLFVGTVMLMLSFVVEKVVAPPTTSPATGKAGEVAPSDRGAAHATTPSIATPGGAKTKPGDRS